MRNVTCDKCNAETAINESIKIDGKVFCKNCLETEFSDEQDLSKYSIENEMDPTVCSSCGKDFGESELKKISGYPLCDDCQEIIKNRTFPFWVKAFFISILIIVIFGFIWNWNYYRAFNDIQKSNEYFQNGNYEKAAFYMTNASEKVTEISEFKTYAQFFNGLNFLSKDKSSEALKLFYECKDKIPQDFNIQNLILQAEMGESFDKKDYDGFLGTAIQYLKIDSTIAVSNATVASAYSCVYAQNGDDEAKNKAYHYLNIAKSMDDTSKEA